MSRLQSTPRDPGAAAMLERISASEVARALRVSKQAIDLWCARGIPLARLVEVAALTGLPPERLRPDIVQLLDAASLAASAKGQTGYLQNVSARIRSSSE